MSNWTKSLLLAVLLVLLLGACQPAPAQPAPASLAIMNGALWDGSQLIADGVVILRGNRIEAAGPAGTTPIPADARIVDAGGGTILPGLIDGHVHNAAEPEIRRKFLEAGVTSVCDTGAGAVQLRQYQNPQEGLPAARAYFAGPFLSAPGGYPADTDDSARLGVGTPEEARQAVQQLAAGGADFIKVALDDGRSDEPLPVLSTEVLQAVTDEAHRLGLTVRAHVLDVRYLDAALDAGVDAIEHIPAPELSRQVFELWMQRDLPLPLPRAYLDELQRLAGRQIPLTPTIEVLERRTCNAVARSEKERTACVRVYIEALRQYRLMGGLIALGSDYGSAGMAAGLPWREMEFMQQAGWSNAQILTAATSNAARACGQAGEIGSLQPGYLADLVIVDGNPLEDLTALQRVLTVVLNGQIVIGD
jgi:imidazolonepropionase-like amidohydrolase